MHNYATREEFKRKERKRCKGRGLSFQTLG